MNSIVKIFMRFFQQNGQDHYHVLQRGYHGELIEQKILHAIAGGVTHHDDNHGGDREGPGTGRENAKIIKPMY